MTKAVVITRNQAFSILKELLDQLTDDSRQDIEIYLPAADVKTAMDDKCEKGILRDESPRQKRQKGFLLGGLFM